MKIKLFFTLLLATLLSSQAYASSAPNINLKTIRNTQVSLQELQGKVVLITFWASNCKSCLAEIEDLKSLYQDYHKQGLELFAVSMYYDRPNYVVAASKNYKIPYDIVLDLRGGIAKAFGQVELIPTTFLIDTTGEIVYQTTGIFTLSDMQMRIQSLLNKQKD
ncbi:MAG: TlpA disulfide reductase family protein [Methyloprofundus sp.]|nr:TlpA disulfide reductase family protein [Methyloprofundus sp.]